MAIRRFCYGPAGTFVYHTTTTLREADRELLDTAAAVFAGANRLGQPCYPAFQGGQLSPLDLPLNTPFTCLEFGQARFDLGLGKDRVYNQLVVSAAPDANTRVTALRSVSGGETPAGTVKAYTLRPTADVLQLYRDRLFWYHIVTTGGTAILPPRLDKWLMNSLRLPGLDRRERQTYRDEATGVHTMTREQWLALAQQLAER